MKKEMEKRMDYRRGKSGQMFSADMLLAIIIFIVILIGVIWLGDFVNEKISYNENRRDMAVMAAYATSGLVESAGSPASWDGLALNDFNETNVLSLGLVDEEKGAWQLDYGKVSRLGTLYPTKYETLKKLIGLRGPDYEFQLVISPENLPQVSVGLAPELNSSNVIVVERDALLNNRYTNVTLLLWEHCTRGCT
jgi:hypothetical protein